MNKLWHLAWVWMFCCGASSQAFGLSISIDRPLTQGRDVTVERAIDDAVELLETACNCDVGINQPAADVHLMVPAIRPGAAAKPSRFAENRTYPYLHYPEHHYRWVSREQSGQVLLVLESPTAPGIANGIYGLLQEKLGFRFIHPRETIFPCFNTWPLPANFSFEGRPRFDKKGFHLHTQHPLELTEVLHDPDFPGGQALIRQYIDWLARNQQNFFDFNLLETVDFDRWLPYARQTNDYAHERGILTSTDVSLHMVQQYAYKLVHFPPWSFRSFEKQIGEGIDDLVGAGFDIINMEFSIAEFVGGMEGLRLKLRQQVLEKIREYPQVKLMGRQHVVRAEDELGRGNGPEPDFEDPERGVMIHTVMCYALTDEIAPVYELENFHHLREALEAENKVRETWFYPESSYWITFDNSVPMLLLPYLDARFRDLRTAEKMGIPGHITFSSGWEWGYWMVDWSIARWSWEFRENGQEKVQTPTMAVEDIFGRPAATRTFANMIDIQQTELLEFNLLRWLCPSTLPDEVGGAVGKQFQPRPSLALGTIYEEAPPAWHDSLVQAAVDLRTFGQHQVQSAANFLRQCPREGMAGRLASEVGTALRITGMYALHQAAWYQALDEVVYADADPDVALERCEEIREFALPLVAEMERNYRYPAEHVARKRPSFTAYQYGYLYPVSQLHFWERREEQLRRGKLASPFFMNIFDPTRIGGLRK